MSVRRDPDAILASWLDEGPNRLPEVTKRAIAVTTRSTRQARRPRWSPWRFPTMNGASRLALAAMAVVAISLGGLYLAIGTRPGGIGGPPGSPTPLPSPSTPGLPPGGTVTLTDLGCTWEANPGTMTMPDALRIRFRNETGDHGVFILHWIKPEHTYADGVEYVADLQRRLTTGEDWPTNDISLAVDNADVPAGADAILEWTTAGTGEGPLEEFRTGANWRWEPGTYGIVCSANTSPTGDILTTFLVGPLELDGVIASPRPSASR